MDNSNANENTALFNRVQELEKKVERLAVLYEKLYKLVNGTAQDVRETRTGG